MNAGGPMISASTYMPSSAIWIATRSTAINARTRPPSSRPCPDFEVLGSGATRRPGRAPATPSGSAVRGVSVVPRSGRQLLTRMDQVVDVGVPAGLGAVRHAELAVGVREVELDGLLGHPELPGDAAVGLALGDQAQDLQLALRERALLLLLGRRRARLVAVHDVALGDLAEERAQCDRVD